MRGVRVMKEVIGYVAGIIDGEGSILLSKQTKNAQFRCPIVSVSSTTMAILEFLQAHYGGSISKAKTYQAHHKPSWSWKVSYNGAIKICTDVLPLLLEPEKVRRAKLLVFSYPEVTRRNGRYSEEELLAKMRFEEEFLHPSTACLSV